MAVTTRMMAGIRKREVKLPKKLRRKSTKDKTTARNSIDFVGGGKKKCEIGYNLYGTTNQSAGVHLKKKSLKIVQRLSENCGLFCCLLGTSISGWVDRSPTQTVSGFCPTVTIEFTPHVHNLPEALSSALNFDVPRCVEVTTLLTWSVRYTKTV